MAKNRLCPQLKRADAENPEGREKNNRWEPTTGFDGTYFLGGKGGVHNARVCSRNMKAKGKIASGSQEGGGENKIFHLE